MCTRTGRFVQSEPVRAHLQRAQDCSLLVNGNDIWDVCDEAIQIFYSLTACYKRTHRGEIEACSPLPFDCLSMFVALRRRLMARGRSTTGRLQPSWPGGWCGVAERLPTLLYCSSRRRGLPNSTARAGNLTSKTQGFKLGLVIMSQRGFWRFHAPAASMCHD